MEGDPIWENIASAVLDMEERAQKIVDGGLADMSQRAAMRLAGWLPTTPLEKAVEWFDFDFEWAHNPDVTSLQVLRTLTNWGHLVIPKVLYFE